MYKLIAVDMDGTLLREDKTISERTKVAIQNAHKQGVKVVLASGRPIEGLSRYLEELGLCTDEDYVLSYNGSIVQNVGTREIIAKSTLKGTDLMALYETARKLNINIHAFSKDGCITPKMSEYSELEGRINGIPVHEVDYSEIALDEDIIKIMLIDPEEVLEAAIKKLPQELYDTYTVVRSAPFFLEFLNKKSGKATGVAALAKHLGIAREEIICIGDAGNDLDMIEYAGLGVAMGNAFEEVKAAADYVTATNEADGVAEVIEKFVAIK